MLSILVLKKDKMTQILCFTLIFDLKVILIDQGKLFNSDWTKESMTYG